MHTFGAMKLWAISDLHLDFAENRRVLARLPAHPEDWLALAGDVSHRLEHLELCLKTLRPRFRGVVWVPGNHDLWTETVGGEELRGEAKYLRQVELCRAHGVHTPEDPYPELEVGGRRHLLVPLHLLYDYSFRPPEVPLDGAVAWAVERGILCADEHYLHPDPYPSRQAWCEARCAAAERRLARLDPHLPLLLVSHFPLRRDLVQINIPRFAIWCGTTRTEQWHRRFNVVKVVSGHLHVPSRRTVDGVEFCEVSLGYPKQWRLWPLRRGLKRVL